MCDCHEYEYYGALRVIKVEGHTIIERADGVIVDGILCTWPGSHIPSEREKYIREEIARIKEEERQKRLDKWLRTRGTTALGED
ncbi:MAG: hypothetical protein QXL88_01525 [Candidatus Pacearchaeota archaeon]